MPRHTPALALVVSALLLLPLHCHRASPPPPPGDGDALDSIWGQVHDAGRLRAASDSLALLGNKDVERCHVLKQLGRMLRNSSDFSAALDAHREGLRLARLHADTVEVVRAYNNIGTDYRRMGSLNEAATHHYAALRLNDSYSRQECYATRKNRVTALNGLGNIYLSMGDMALADSIFRQALATEHALGSHVGQAINLANIGSIFESLGQTDSARAYYALSLAENEEAHSQLGIALCHINFGSLHEREGNSAAATDEYLTAYGLLAGGHDQWHWLQAAVRLAHLHLSTGDVVASQHFADTAWTVATAIGSVEHQAEVARLRSALAERRGDMPAALELFRQSMALSDSVASLQKISDTHALRLRYNEGVIRNEMDSMQRLFDAERRLMTMTIVAVALALSLALAIVAALVAYMQRRAKKQRQLIADYERQIEVLTREQQSPTADTADSGTTAAAPADGGDTGGGGAAKAPIAADADKAFLIEFHRLIHANLNSPRVNSAMLADAMGMTQRLFSRRVRELTQLDTQTCIRAARIAEAKRLLRETDMPVLDIANRCGFDTASYFSRVFHREEGISPSDYRRTAREG